MIAVRALLDLPNFGLTLSGKRSYSFAFVVALLSFFGAAAGCKKTEPTPLAPFQIHAITKELASAARAAAPKGTDIRTALRAGGGNPQAADQLDITLAPSEPVAASRNDAAKIQQALAGVATRHGLTEKPSENRDGILFFYLKAGVATHAVHIHFSSKLSEGAESATIAHSGPELAIILDDLGSDKAVAEAIFALPYPLTISV